jgi:DNA (cytosine-5)-methyltransferase 1
VKHETKTMHLFAGIGGGLLADLILGHRPIVAVEWDKYACKVLRERATDGWFPGLHVWEGDVRLFDPSEYTGIVDCIHAGFPCQDISVAGKQAGVSEGTRSGLYREILRIAGVVRPKQLFLENVSAILSNGLGTVLGDLASLGYDTRWLCIRASDVGAPHHRDRWFLLANANGNNGRTSCMGQDAGADRGNEFGGMGEILADTDSAQRQRSELAKRSEKEYANTSCPSWWEVEPRLGRVADGISHRVGQLKGYGNAQVPLQAATAYRLLGGL